MLKICDENRQEIENEYMALLLNKNDVWKITQIKAEYLKNKRNQKMFDYVMESYQKYECVEPAKIVEKHKDFDMVYFLELMEETFWHESAWKEQLKLSEESIVSYYKEDIIKMLNARLESGKIGYDDFMEKMKKLDNIILVDNTPELTSKEIMESISEEKARVQLIKYGKLDEQLKLVQGDFLIIGATTGAGKSGFMLNLMNDLMERYQCIYFNMEMSKATIYKRLVSIQANLQIKEVENPTTQFQVDSIAKATGKIERARMIIEHQASDIKQIRNVVAKLKRKDKHTILFIDHLGLTKADGTKSLYEQATEVAKQLRQMCLEYDCTIISASQLNRTAYGSDAVSLNMLKDSGELENSASKVILLYKESTGKDDPENTIMNVEIAKNRDGVCGKIKMAYNKTKQVFNENIPQKYA